MEYSFDTPYGKFTDSISDEEIEGKSEIEILAIQQDRCAKWIANVWMQSQRVTEQPEPEPEEDNGN